MKTKLTYFTLMVALLALVGAIPDARSQTEPEGTSDTTQNTLEEVIVTAQKREQRVIDVPISMTVFSAEDIKNNSFSDLVDIAQATPNLLGSMTGAGSHRSDLVIRGVSSPGSSGFSPSLGVYVDEVYMGRPRGFNQVLNDIERIEVLRGPQGTLFGRNTTGGAISITTVKPTNEFRMNADVTYGVDNLMQFRGNVDGPLVQDKILGQFSAVFKQQDGFIYNEFRDEYIDDVDEHAFRGKLVFTPNDDLRIEFSGDYHELDNSPTYETVQSFIPVPFKIDPTDRVILEDSESFATRTMWGGYGRFDLDLSDKTLTSISAYRTYDSNARSTDGLPYRQFTSDPAEDLELFTQEIRLASSDTGRLTWIVGAYYLHETVDSNIVSTYGDEFPAILFAPALGGFLEPFMPGEFEDFTTRGTIKTDSFAGFVNMSYELTEKLTLTGGFRYTWDKRDAVYEQTIDHAVPTTLTLFPPLSHVIVPLPSTIVGLTTTPIPETRDDRDDAEPTWDLALSYEFVTDTIGYAKTSRGYKSGGFNLAIISPPNTIADQYGFGPETVDNFEVGLKTRLFNNKVSLNMAAFVMNFDNKQESVRAPLVGFFVSNVAGAEISGAEIDFIAKPNDILTISGNVGFLDSEYTEYPNVDADFTGNELPFAPNFSGALFAQVDIPVASSRFNLMSRLGVEHTGDFYTSGSNTADILQESVTTLSGRIGLGRSDGRYGVYLWGRNLTDETILGPGLTVLTVVTQTINRGREWGLEFRVNL